MATMYRAFLTALVAFFGMGFASNASAQTIPEKVRLVIEELDSDAIRCGLSLQSLRGAAFSGLRFNRIDVDNEDLSSAYLYIRVTVIRLSSGLCASQFEVSFRQYDALPTGSGAFVSGIFEYCHVGGILTGGDHGNRIPVSIRDGVGECLAKIRTATSPSIDRLIREIGNEASAALD